MSAIRAHLRLWAVAWLALQAASLSAFAPRACCEAHEAAGARPGCHEETPATHCPMRSADGTACPMHRASETAPNRGAECGMRGNCDGPMAALGNLLSQQGVAPSSFDIPFNPETSPAAFVSPEQLIGQFVPPDPPPPRA